MLQNVDIWAREASKCTLLFTRLPVLKRDTYPIYESCSDQGSALASRKACSSNKAYCENLQAAMEVHMTKAGHILDLTRAKRARRKILGVWRLDFDLDSEV